MDVMDGRENPDGELAKEVYAHFGLCLSLSQVFETGMINVLTSLQTKYSDAPSRIVFDNYYEANKKLTFSNLRSALSEFEEFPTELEEEIKGLKAKRDYLAHSFFRNHDQDFISVSGALHMIEELEAIREEFVALDTKLSRFQDEVLLALLGMDSDTFKNTSQNELGAMLLQARQRYASDIHIED